jgi:hypothetical protein
MLFRIQLEPERKLIERYQQDFIHRHCSDDYEKLEGSFDSTRLKIFAMDQYPSDFWDGKSDLIKSLFQSAHCKNVELRDELLNSEIFYTLK